MLDRRSLSRRQWLSLAALAVGAPVVAAVHSLTARMSALHGPSRRVTIGPLQQDITFADDVVVCRNGDSVRVFAARCTHLGCRISQQADGELVCSCHGSRFRLDGSVARGPASKPLEVLAHRIDPRTGIISVDAG